MLHRKWIIFALIFAALGGVYVLQKHFGAEVILNHLVVDASRFAEISTTSPQSSSPATSTEKFKLPIIVYHIVRPSLPTDSIGVRTIALTPENFDAEMKYLETAGYHVVRFSDLEAHVASSTPLPTKPIIISFDDGWSDQFTYAFPILKKYDYPATFFIFTNSIGRKGFLNWVELRQLVASGMTIGDHSRSHPYLNKITDAEKMWSEIYESKQILEKNLNVTVNEFAYPFGRYNPEIIDLVKKAGYESARGDFYSGQQSPDRLFELSAMNAPTTTVLFAQKFP